MEAFLENGYIVVNEWGVSPGFVHETIEGRIEFDAVAGRAGLPVQCRVEQMRMHFGDSAVFGREKDQSLHRSLNTVMQGFDGKDLYPSVEEKAAHLLYFIVKNHSFVDGNKRIAAAVFLRFAEKNKLIFDKEGQKHIADNALVAMTLMIAESKPKEKDVITAMLTNLIAGDEWHPERCR